MTATFDVPKNQPATAILAALLLRIASVASACPSDDSVLSTLSVCGPDHDGACEGSEQGPLAEATLKTSAMRSPRWMRIEKSLTIGRPS